MNSASDETSIPTCGFEPISTCDARVLILGSLPSRQSLKQHQYYGNPQNAFWRIMGNLFGATPEISYGERTTVLMERRVAIWDVLQSSIRSGSLDANIRLGAAVANDFASFYTAHSKLRLVAFNGKKAAQLFTQLVPENVREKHRHMEYITLPSTSPAHAAMNYSDKLAAWSAIRQAVQT